MLYVINLFIFLFRLLDDKTHLIRMHSTLELVFGYGGSNCIGVNVVYMEMNKIIFKVRKLEHAPIYKPS